MAEVVWRIVVIMAKMTVISLSVVALVTLLTIIISALMIGLNFGVINDLIAIVQMWLPFNFSVILIWIVTVAFAYIAYRLSVVAINYMNAWLND